MVMEPKGEKVGAVEDVLTSGLCVSAELTTASHGGSVAESGGVFGGRYHEGP